jgi:hypothetical protein
VCLKQGNIDHVNRLIIDEDPQTKIGVDVFVVFMHHADRQVRASTIVASRMPRGRQQFRCMKENQLRLVRHLWQVPRTQHTGKIFFFL